jgi:CheY-like chemotaxis protein
MTSVLVVDDDVTVRAFCRSALQTAGFAVREAASGDEGLGAYRSRPADLVLCDIEMPGRDGLGTINELRRAYYGVKVVAMSGSDVMLEVAIALGAAGTLSKPFAMAELLSAVDRALE